MKQINILLNPDYIFGSYNYKQINISDLRPLYNEKLSNKYFFSTGITIQFITNSKKIDIKGHVTNYMCGKSPHVGITAGRGMCFQFKRMTENEWINFDCIAGHENFFEKSINMERYTQNYNNKFYHFAMLCPILSCIDDLHISIDDDAIIKIDNTIDRTKPIVILGGKISYGIGTTTSAYLYSNMLLHKTNREVFNFSISTGLTYNDEIYKIIKSINPHNTIIECDENLTKAEIIHKWLPKCINQLEQNNILIIQNGITYKKSILNLLNELSNKYTFKILDGNDIFLDNDKELCSYNTNYVNDYYNVLLMKQIIKYME